MIKKVIKSGGHRAHFNITVLANTAIYGTLAKMVCSPKLDKKERFLQCGITQNLTQMYCLFTLCTRKMPFNALVFILHSKVDLICIEHMLFNLLLIAHQSVCNLPTLPENFKHRFMPFFSH